MKNRDTLIQYLRMKTDEGDWHGVADAAMDLREVDAEAKGVERGWREAGETVRTLNGSHKQAEADRPCEHPANLTRYNIISGKLECMCGASLEPNLNLATSAEAKGRM